MRQLIAAGLVLFLTVTTTHAESATGAAAPPGIRASAARVDFNSIDGPSPVRQGALPGAPQRRVGAAMSLGLLGALGGAFVGGAMAGRSATECPWAPFLGMNVGAVIGAISGYRLAR